MWLAVVDSRSNKEPRSLAAEVEQGVEVSVTDLDSEEVRATTTWTGHHYHAVTLDRFEVELDTATAARRPLRQTEVRSSSAERDVAYIGTAGGRCALGGWQSLLPTIFVKNHVDPVELVPRECNQIEIAWQRVADHYRLQTTTKMSFTLMKNITAQYVNSNNY